VTEDFPPSDMRSKSYKFRYNVGDLVHDKRENKHYLVLATHYGSPQENNYFAGMYNYYTFLRLEDGNTINEMAVHIDPDKESERIG